MSTNEKVEITPKKTPEFVHIPKQVHKELLKNTILEALQEARMRTVFPNDYSSRSIDSLLWLLGINAKRVTFEFRGLIDQVFERYAPENLNPDSVHSDRLNKKVRKELKTLISLYQLKFDIYE